MVTKEEALKELNLNEKEVKVYLSLLMLGQSSVSDVAKKANLNRVSTYDILNVLSERGFVSYVIKSGVKYFEAVEPSKFLDELREKEEKMKAVLPQLEIMRASLIKKPNIELYEGLKGLKSIFNDILNENKETRWTGSPKMIDALEFYFPYFIKQKRKQGMFSRVITQDCKSMRKYRTKAPKQYIRMRLIDEKINVTKIIYGDKVAFLTFKEKNSIGILIDNKEVADVEGRLFDILWTGSKK